MKTRTGKIVVMSLVASMLLLASCKKNNNTEVPKEGFAASIEQNGDSKTSLNGLQVIWSAYDQIKVNNGTNTLTFELTNGAGSTDGTFYTGEEHPTFFDPSNHYTAVYPAANPANSSETNTIAGTEATVHLPATQNILANGSFGVGYNPMVAYSSSQTLSFKNLCGALRFQMVGAGITVKTIELTTGDPDDYLSGTFTVVCSSANPVLTPPTSSVSGNNTITLTCPDSGIELSGTTATNFYFMLPPGTLHGVTFTAKNGSGETVYTQTSTKNFTITRNKISPVNELEVPLNVTTTSPFNITTSSAKAGGTVGNGTPAEWGVLYSSTTTDPKEGNEGVTKVNMTSGTAYSGYSGSMSLPADNTTYYVRAYAKTAKGTCYYGTVIPFATRNHNGIGMLEKAFTVASGKTVWFSKGNLYYKKSDGHWRFMDQQYSRIETPDLNVGVDNANQDDISLFGWGTSGWEDSGATCYQPWNTSNISSDYTPGGTYTIDLTGSYYNADWGHNSISGGGGTVNWWRVLSSSEWNYLLNGRSASTVNGKINVRYAKARINVSGSGINGLIIFPDAFSWPSSVPDFDAANLNNATIACTANQLTEAQWSLLEHEVCVFLPLAGYRRVDDSGNPTVIRVNSQGYYWSSSHSDAGNAYDLYITYNDNGVVAPLTINARCYGFSVRLVSDEPYNQHW